MATDKRFLENMAERIVDIAGLDIYDSRLNHLGNYTYTISRLHVYTINHSYFQNKKLQN